jgi:hypothetical protein
MNDQYRLVERPWDVVERRRYAVERLAFTLDDGSEHWSLERFFGTTLEAQCYLARLRRGPRVITELRASAD